ncbi:MAG: hypothetical protein ACRD3W_08320, partial [Terriglobales bacterium]
LWVCAISLLVAAGHSCALLFARLSRIQLGNHPVTWSDVRRQSGAVAIALLLFAPWLMVIRENQTQLKHSLSWTTEAISASDFLTHWEHLICKVICNSSSFERYDAICVTLILALLLVFVRHASKKARTVLFSLIACSALPLLIPDLAFGGIRSITTKYMLPMLFSLQLVVACALSVLIGCKRPVGRYAGIALTALILITEGASAAINSGQIHHTDAMSWDQELRLTAQLVKQSGKGVIISGADDSLGQALALVRYLAPDTAVILCKHNRIIAPPEFDGAIVFNIDWKQRPRTLHGFLLKHLQPPLGTAQTRAKTEPYLRVLSQIKYSAREKISPTSTVAP